MRTIIGFLFFIAIAVQGFGDFPAIAAGAPPVPPLQSSLSATASKPTITGEIAKENTLGYRPYVVRRESSGPPGESHSGRASSSPIRGFHEPSRQSSQPLDLSAEDLEKQIQSENAEIEKEIGTTPTHRRDPSEGGGQSHPVIKKRRGVLD